MDESGSSTPSPQFLQPAPAQGIIRTHKSPALRHDDNSYLPAQGVEALPASPSKVPSPVVGIPGLLEGRKAGEMAAPGDGVPRVELEMSRGDERPALEAEQQPSEAGSMPSTIFPPTPPLSRSPSTASPDKETWGGAISKAIDGIVAINFTVIRPFDTEAAGNYNATGFVISKKHGLILSNRHVVSVAPITAIATFENYKEMPVYPVYRDPVHDFGIFRYDPSGLKHTNVEEIELRPDLARVGEDIKVVGNDAGEKLSILGSTLARMDRQAPCYGLDTYEDFNTFYMQAASGTSGGSSGSPVLNINGQAIALNAGGNNNSQSSFYLPLHRVVRAVDKIKKGEVVSRGTLQTEFVHNSYDELRRLGLPEELEDECRTRDSSVTGLLVISRVLKGGPASPERKEVPNEAVVARVRGLEPGDILFACNGEYIVDFLGLWNIIDESVGKDIVLEIYRGAKEGMSGETGRLQVVCTVQDLHSINPGRFLEIGGAVFHDLSYQMARKRDIPLESGVFCAASGFIHWDSFSRDFLITHVDGKPTKTLDQFVDVIKGIPDYKRVQFMTRALGANEDKMVMVDIDRHFFSSALFERDDKAGTWIRQELEPPPLEEAPDILDEKGEDVFEPEMEEEDPEDVALDVLGGSLVAVLCRLPHPIYGYFPYDTYSGVGLVVSLSPVPLILFDRTAIPTEMLEIRLTISNKHIPGRVVYLGAFALVTLDSKDLPKSVRLPEWDPKPLKVRDEVDIIGLTMDQILVRKETTVGSIGMNFNTWRCDPPRHRLVNIANINLSDSPRCWGGVLVRKGSKTGSDKEKLSLKVSAYYMSCLIQGKSGGLWAYQGLDVQRYVLPVVARINEEIATGPVELPCRDLGIEFADSSLATASTRGLSQKRFDAYVKAAKKIRGVPRPLRIESLLRPLPNSPQDKEGGPKIADIVLEIDGKPIYHISQLTELDLESKESVEMVVLRGDQEVTLTAPTTFAYPSTGTHIVQFYGAVVHATHAAAIETIDCANLSLHIPISAHGIYISGLKRGSPASSSLSESNWIIEVDGVSVSSLDDLIDVVKSKKWKTGDYIRVKSVDRMGVTNINSLRTDERFWPVVEWKQESFGGRRWVQTRISGAEFIESII